MSKEHFRYHETAKLVELLDEAARRSGVSRGQAFDDFLHMSVCALSGGRMEEQYLTTIAKHSEGPKGRRGVDSLSRMFGTLVDAMEQDSHDRMKDIVGDLFEGAITYGEAGQFLTPDPICDLMARMTIDADTSPERKSVFDPCCGSGRMLLAAAQVNRHWEFAGQDVDIRCVRMTALNLAFRNLYGYVLWGNTLALETKLIYRTGFDGRGFLREVRVEACPVPVQKVAAENPPITPARPALDAGGLPLPTKQLHLF